MSPNTVKFVLDKQGYSEDLRLAGECIDAYCLYVRTMILSNEQVTTYYAFFRAGWESKERVDRGE